MRLLNRTAAFMLVLAASSLWAAPASAQHRIAYSEANGIEVLARTSEWCSINVELEFRLADHSRLRDGDALTRFAPDIGPAIVSQCLQVRTANIRIADENGIPFPASDIYQIRADLNWGFANPPQVDFLGSGIETPSVQRAQAAEAATARRMTNDDLVRAIFRYLPQYADLDQYPGTLNSLGAMYECDLMRQAENSNEFARRGFDREVRRHLDRLASSAADIDPMLFLMSYSIPLGEYDFDMSAFQVAPVRARLDIGLDLQAAEGCQISQSRGLPWDVYLRAPESAFIDRLPMSERRGEALLSALMSRGAGRRSVDVEVTYRLTGASANNAQLDIEFEPVRIRFLEPDSGPELYVMDSSEMGRIREAVEEAERLAEEARGEAEREATRADLLRRREDAEDEIRRRLEYTERREERIFRVHAATENHYVSYGHPSLLAAVAGAAQRSIDVVTIFKAGRNDGETWQSDWPSSLSVSVVDGVEAEIEMGQWVVVSGKLSGVEPSDQPGLYPAEIEAEWVFICEDEFCEADAETDNLLQAYIQRLDDELQENLATLSVDDTDGGEAQ